MLRWIHQREIALKPFRLGHSPTYRTTIALPSISIQNSSINFTFRFYDRWDFPNTVSKHIYMRSPDNSGTTFFNYKKSFSINLMAIVDADYKFLVVDIGQMGSASNGGVWDNSNFGLAWNRDRVNIPPLVPLPGTETPYVLVADEALPLKPNLMRPYPGREATNNMRKRRYNYRLSRARRVVENDFGIPANCWRFLFNPVDADPEKLTVMVNEACVLCSALCPTPTTCLQDMATQYTKEK